MKININDTVRVQLTAFGKEVLRKKFDETLRPRYPKLKFALPEEDSGGWSSWQLWYLMNTFGECMFLDAQELPFRTEIELGDGCFLKEQDAGGSS